MKIKLIVGGLISCATLYVPVYANFSGLNLTPYGGVDFGMQNFGFKGGYGDNLFKKQLPKGNLFAGVKFNDYFGVEGGYETTIEKKKESKINTGGKVLGNVIPPGTDYIKYSSRDRISGWHIGITGNYPIQLQGSCNLSMIGYFGVKRASVRLDRDGIADKITGYDEDPYSRKNLLTSKKNLVRLNAGFEYLLMKHVGVRALVGWENTSRLKPKEYSAGTLINQAKLKDSISYSIGIVFK